MQHFVYLREWRGRGGRVCPTSQYCGREALTDVSLHQWLNRAARRARLRHCFFPLNVLTENLWIYLGFFFLLNNASKLTKETNVGLLSWRLQGEILHCVGFLSRPGPEKSSLALRTAGLRSPPLHPPPFAL